MCFGLIHPFTDASCVRVGRAADHVSQSRSGAGLLSDSDGLSKIGLDCPPGVTYEDHRTRRGAPGGTGCRSDRADSEPETVCTDRFVINEGRRIHLGGSADKTPFIMLHGIGRSAHSYAGHDNRKESSDLTISDS